MYIKNVELLKYHQVEAFVAEQNRESIALEYKGDWPKGYKLANIIAAMANTQGGDILVGVLEDNKTGEPGTITGVGLGGGADDLRRKVTNIIAEHIFPPLTPEIGVAPLADQSDRAVVVIRVAPSDMAPHFTDQRRRVYIRADSMTDATGLADVDQLSWLWSKRERAREAGQALVDAARQRGQVLVVSPMSRGNPPRLTVSIAPEFYSGAQPIAKGDIRQLFDDVQMRRTDIRTAVYRDLASFPIGQVLSRAVHNGSALYRLHQQRFFYMEANTSGCMYMTCNVYMEENDEWYVDLRDCVRLLDGFMRLASLVNAKASGAIGPVRFRVTVHSGAGRRLYGSPRARVDEPEDRTRYLGLSDDLTVLDDLLTVSCLGGQRPELVKRATRTLVWAFGDGSDDDQFDKWYRRAVVPKEWHLRHLGE